MEQDRFGKGSSEGPGTADAELLSVFQRISRAIDRHVPDAGCREFLPAGLTLTRHVAPTPPEPLLFEPSLYVVIRGSVELTAGEEARSVPAQTFALTPIALPGSIAALPGVEEAHASLRLAIDLEEARELIAEVESRHPEAPVTRHPFAVGPVTLPLAAPIARLVDLLDEPSDIPILARSIHREILYRLLSGPSGAGMRQALLAGIRPGRATKAIRWLKENYVQPLRIGDLAALAGVGASTLHHHFRALTSMSPLQFQKHLRLHEARRLLLNESVDVATAAFRVGYRSVTQFTREYKRLFGVPPRRDVRELLSSTNSAH